MTDTFQQAQLPSKSAFETIIDGKETSLYILKNNNGVEAAITNYGGCIAGMIVPDKAGKKVDVVEGFASIESYQTSTEPYYGALIGRVANRIADGRFVLEGKAYTLVKNNDNNTLHGGTPGFQDRVWDAKQTDQATLVLTYLAKDMEGGFPGNLMVKVTYSLTDDNSLRISYEATTDKTTVVNLTSHPYFNLNGAGTGSVLNHEVQILADAYIPVNSNLIPTGKIEQVKDTPFDFTQLNTIAARINEENEQLKDGKGYDHTYVLDAHELTVPVAIAIGDRTGIEMKVFTSEPGMQFYSGNHMYGKNIMKYGNKDEFRTAFAMETQHYPDSPNQLSFPSVVLKPGQVYKSFCAYQFGITSRV